MAILVWDKVGERFYETGLDHAVLYPLAPDGTYGPGVAWNGLISVSETPSGAEPTPIYADNIRYLTLTSLEEFSATIEAYTFPSEFALLDGSVEPTPGLTIGQQPRGMFGLVYRTRVGNDVVGDTLGYKYHLLYGLRAQPSERSYQTVNDSPEAVTFSWELSSTPVPVTGHQPTSLLIVDDRAPYATGNLEALLESLFGRADSDPVLLSPDGVMATLSMT